MWLLHDAPSLPSLTLSGADWTFTRLTCLMGGLQEWEHWPLVLPPWCGVYDSADYTTIMLQKMRFCAAYMRVQVIRVCGVYA